MITQSVTHSCSFGNQQRTSQLINIKSECLVIDLLGVFRIHQVALHGTALHTYVHGMNLQ